MSVCGKIGRATLWSVRFFFRQLPAALGVLLLVQLGLLHVAVSEFKIPDFLVSYLSDYCRSQGLRCDVDEIYLRNLTVLTAKGVRLDTLRGNEPLLKIRRCAVKFAPEVLFSRNFIPRFFYVDGVEAFCPSVNSASGHLEPLLSDGALVARRDRGEIEISSARCRVGTFSAVVYGKIPGTREFFFGGEAVPAEEAAAEQGAPAAKSDALKIAVSDKLSSLLSGVAGKLSAALSAPELHYLPGNVLAEIRLSPSGKTAISADAAIFCRDFDVTDRLRFEKIAATQKFFINPQRRIALPRGPVRVSAENASFSVGNSFPDRVTVRARGVSAAAMLPEEVFSENASAEARLPKKIFLSVGKLCAASPAQGVFNFSGCNAVVSPEAEDGRVFPCAYRFGANLSSGAQQLAVAGTFNAAGAAPSLKLDYNFSFDKKEIFARPQMRFLAENADLKALRFGERPQLRGSLSFAEGMRFEKATLELLAGTTDCGVIHLCSLYAAGVITPDEVRFPKVRAAGADYVANANVYVEIGGQQRYRVRTWGSVDPHCIDGRLGWFWERIWRDLRPAPSLRRPRADIDVYGKWTDRWEYVFGAIAGENCWGNGVIVDKVCLRVFEDPLLISAFDMLFLRGNDRVTGNLQWHYKMEPRYHYRDFRFLFEGSIPPKDVLQIIGEGLPEALSDLETEGAGSAVVSGMFSGSPEFYPDRMVVNVDGRVPGKFSIFGIKGEDFAGQIIYDNGVVFVGNPFTANSGPAGTVSGKVRVTFPEDGHGIDGSKVEIKLDLQNIRRTELSEAFAAIGARVDAHDGKKHAEHDDTAHDSDSDGAHEGLFPAEDNSRICASFAGTLFAPDLDTLDAAGKFTIDEDGIFELQVFGGFSRLLSSVKIDLTTFNLDSGEGSYVVRGGKIYLPDMRIYSDTGEVCVQADVTISELDVVGDAVFRNLRWTRVPVIGTVVRWGSSSTSLLPVEISGSLDNLQWKINPTPSRLWAEPEARYGFAPARNSTCSADAVPADAAAPSSPGAVPAPAN